MSKKYFVWFVSVLSVLCLVLGACTPSEDDQKIEVTTSAKDFKKENYKDVEAVLKDTGFKNIKKEKKEDLVTGWLAKEGEVEQVSIDGDSDFAEGASFDKDSKIVITYHAFEKTSETSKTSDTSTASSTATQSSTPQETALTAQNNADFAHILTASDDFDAYNGFVQKYKDQIIEFDGNIASLANSEEYSTRFDILMYSGDYSTTSSSGAAFRLENVSPATIKYTGENVPDSLKEGQNVHIKAKVLDYNSGGDLIIIDPIEMSMR